MNLITRFYMENRGIRYYAFTDSSDISGFSVPEKRKLVHSALIIREKIIDMFRERGIEGDRLALVAAITLGQKNMLDPEQKQYFIKAGVMHIMAVSGLHAVILSLFIFNLLFFLKGRLNILRVSDNPAATMVICFCHRTHSFGSESYTHVHIPSGREYHEKTCQSHKLSSCFSIRANTYQAIGDLRCRIPALLFCSHFHNQLLSRLLYEAQIQPPDSGPYMAVSSCIDHCPGRNAAAYSDAVQPLPDMVHPIEHHHCSSFISCNYNRMPCSSYISS